MTKLYSMGIYGYFGYYGYQIIKPSTNTHTTMITFTTAPASELPIVAEVALRIMTIQATGSRSGPEFYPTDQNMIRAVRLAKRFIDIINYDPDDEEEANAFFAQQYVNDTHNQQFNPTTQRHGQVQ